MTDSLRDQVRDRYAQAARAVLDPAGGAGCGCGSSCCTHDAAPGPAVGDEGCCDTSSCCGGQCATTAAALEQDGHFGAGLYSEGETDGLPADAVTASLGCGNPLAVAELRTGERVLDLGSGGGIDVLLSARRVGPSGKAYGLD